MDETNNLDHLQLQQIIENQQKALDQAFETLGEAREYIMCRPMRNKINSAILAISEVRKT